MIALPRQLGIIALTFIATFPVVQLNARADEAPARVQVRYSESRTPMLTIFPGMEES
jgi:hypothetical protein